MMKKRSIEIPFKLRIGVAFLLIMAASAVQAQIGIEVKSTYAAYLRYEPIEISVTIRNYSGNTLAFGEDNSQNYLHFIIEREAGERAAKIKKDANLVRNLILSAGETKQIVFTLNSIYNMQKEGAYTIYGQLGHQRLNHDFRSTPFTLQVTGGLVIWDCKLGIPSGASGAKIEAREAFLLLMHREAGELYCLRIEDSKRVYSVVRLGPKIAGSEPELDVDGVSNIHILYMLQPRLYSYRVYDFNGQLRQEKFYLPEGSIPRLLRDPDIGRIMVVGGREAVAGVDFRHRERKYSSGTRDEAQALNEER